jgi:hypothetical protein
MPSGFKIDWSKFDDIIRSELPKLTIEEFTLRFIPGYSSKAVGARARKLGIKSNKTLSEQHKKAIAISLTKESSELVREVRRLRDQLSNKELCKRLGIGYATLSRIIKRNNITLSDIGRQRVRLATSIHGKTPWNKGVRMPVEFGKRISEKVSGERNGQFGRGMTEQEKRRWRSAYFSNGIFKIRTWLSSPIGQEALRKSNNTTQSPEFRQRCSELMNTKIRSGEYTPHCIGYGEIVQSQKGGVIRTKSTWETRYIKLLDVDEDVISFQYEPFSIRYEFEGVIKHYYPDFLVVRENICELVEVKPSRLIILGCNPAKFKAAKRFCIEEGLDFVVVTEEKLV